MSFSKESFFGQVFKIYDRSKLDVTSSEKKNLEPGSYCLSLSIKYLNSLYRRHLIESYHGYSCLRGDNWCRNVLLTDQNKVAIESRAIYLSQITARFDTFVAGRYIMNIPSLAIVRLNICHLRLNIYASNHVFSDWLLITLQINYSLGDKSVNLTNKFIIKAKK